ncbi:Hypothetical protein NocV09_02500260, partial [Nannochloropsis oceanica]
MLPPFLLGFLLILLLGMGAIAVIFVRLVTKILPRWLTAHLPGLSFILNPACELYIARFEWQDGRLSWQDGKLCLRIRRFKALLVVRQRGGGREGKGIGAGGGAMASTTITTTTSDNISMNQKEGDYSLQARSLNLRNGMSWFVQIGSRHHPLWQLASPMLKFGQPFLGLASYVRVEVEEGTAEVVLEGGMAEVVLEQQQKEGEEKEWMEEGGREGWSSVVVKLQRLVFQPSVWTTPQTDPTRATSSAAATAAAAPSGIALEVSLGIPSSSS